MKGTYLPSSKLELSGGSYIYTYIYIDGRMSSFSFFRMEWSLGDPEMVGSNVK